jgi:glycosyltransferase involved in cell wall biosynthesis
LVRLQAKPDLHLILCGEGVLRGELQRITSELGIAERVHFLGLIPREELTDILLLSNLFLHPSLSEGFGNVILEAMLHKLVVVSSPVGVGPDVIRHGENGYLALPGDRVEWLDALNNALQRLPDFNQAADANRRTVVEHYSMEARIDDYIEIYEQASRNQARGSLG